MRGRAASAVLVAGCASGDDVPLDDVAARFAPLHAGIYDVWAAPHDRDAIHGVLARAFVGEALTDAYVDAWTARARMAEEGTAVEVLGVEHEALEPFLVPGDDAVAVDASWRVRGVVHHQRHRHARIHRYRAVYTLAETPDGLRVADTRVLDLARVASRIDDVFGEGGDPTGQGFMDPLELFDAGVLDAPEAE